MMLCHLVGGGVSTRAERANQQQRRHAPPAGQVSAAKTVINMFVINMSVISTP